MPDSESLSSPILPTTRAQEPGSTSLGYGDSLNDFANRAINGVAPKDLLRTPAASEAERGHQPEEKARARGGQVTLSGQFLPTPTTQDSKNNGGDSQFDRNTLPLNAQTKLLPTTRTSMKNGATQKEIKANNPKSRIETEVLLQTNWGKFEPAIRRWEKTIDREAPAPTKPDGKDDAHRLSSKFTEWMMGLPEGWITDVGLTRNEELKACGNGVVPQQAHLALKILLEGVEIESGGGQVNFPTPTVADTFTGNLKSSQQKEGSMHSVSLPQAVRWVTE